MQTGTRQHRIIGTAASTRLLQKARDYDLEVYGANGIFTDDIAKQASPIFDRAAAEVATAGESGQPVNITPHIKRAMVELSIQVLLGKVTSSRQV